MAFDFAHGSITWLAADAVNTLYTVSGLSFQPKAIRFYWQGLGSATDAVSGTAHSRRGVGFTNGTTHRAVATQDQNAAGTSVCTSGFRNDCIAFTVTSTPASDGALTVLDILSTGFRLSVSDTAPVDITVFWEAWGGDEITVATVGSIAEPATGGTVDYPVTGFVAGAEDQVVMFAGVASTANVGLAQRSDSGLYVGFAGPSAANSAVIDNVVIVGSSDDASVTMDTDGYCRGDECVAMVITAGGNLSARAACTQFGTDNFRLNWIAAATANRRSIFLAIKGGKWAVGHYAINGGTPGANAIVNGLAFQPLGVSLLGRMTAESTAGTTTVNDRMGLGTGSSTSSRRSMGHLSEDATASSNAEINLAIRYAQALVFPSTIGAVQASYDLTAINADGFQVSVGTVVGGVASEFQGYLTFGTSTGAAAALAGTSTLVLTASGTLSTAITLAGASTLSLVASASLTTAIPLAGVSTLAVLATGGLTTAISLAGVSVLTLTSTGSLTAEITQLQPTALPGRRYGSFAGRTATGAADLAGVSTLTLTATGVLTTGIALAGASALTLTATGGLTTGISLAGVSTLSLGTLGTLTTSIPLAGSSTLTLSTAGALTTAVSLAGASTLTLAATGSLTTAIPLAGTSTLSVLTTGALTTAISLAGTSLLTLTAAGDLTGAASLAGTSTLTLSATGTLTTGIRLAGVSTLTLTATGALTSPAAALAGLSMLTMAGTGALTTGISLAGASTLTLITAADLQTQIRLAGTSLLTLSASGAFLVPIRSYLDVEFMVSAVAPSFTGRSVAPVFTAAALHPEFIGSDITPTFTRRELMELEFTASE